MEFTPDFLEFMFSIGEIRSAATAAPRFTQVSFLWKNPDFLLRNPDFLLRNPDFIIKQSQAGACKTPVPSKKNVDFRLKTDGFRLINDCLYQQVAV